MNLRQAAAAIVPKPLRPVLRNLYHATGDRLEVLLRWRDPLTPPKRMWSLVTLPELDFKKEGEGVRTFLIEKCALQPHEVVLDVGCGIGRNAVPLIGHVSEYYGFDIMSDAIYWCQKYVGGRYSQFHFELADVYNETYNPNGKQSAAEYVFPYRDNHFDLVFLMSVFTHMLYRDVENYLSEISRVLKPGGRAVISVFILNEESRKEMSSGGSAYDFSHKLDRCYTANATKPEDAIAYDEQDLRGLFKKSGLMIREPIIWGTWSATKSVMQDVVIAFKPLL